MLNDTQNMYVEDLVQTFVGPMLAVSVCEFLCTLLDRFSVPCSAFQYSLWLLHFSSAYVELLELQVKKFDGDVTFTLLEMFVSRSHSLCND